MYNSRYDNKAVQLVSILLAVGLWSPSFVIPGAEFQVANLAGTIAAIYFFYNTLRLKTIKVSIVLAFLALLPSWFYGYVFGEADDDELLLIYYLAYCLPLVIAGIVVFTSEKSRFINFFHKVGLLFLTINLVQAIAGSRAIEELRNSKLYSVLHYVDRSALLFPEASGLGQIASLWLVATYILYRRCSIGLFNMAFAIFLYLVCIVTAKSTSSIMLIVVLLFTVYIAEAKLRLASIIRLFFVLFVGAAILMWGLSYLYAERGDSMIMSVMNRFSTILAVLYSLFTGDGVAGLGGNYKIVPFVELVQVWLGIESFIIVDGINSFFFTRLFEEGWLALTPYLVMLLNLKKFSKLDKRNTDLIVFLVASLVISTFLAGYRAYPIMWIQYSIIFVIASRRFQN